MEKVKQLFDAIVGVDAWYIAGSPLLGNITNVDEPNGDPENEVLYFTWVGDEEGSELSERITEEDLANATINGNTITIHDPDGDFDLVLYKLVPYEITDGKVFPQASQQARIGKNPVDTDVLAELETAILRVELANEEGNPILSAWLPDAKAAFERAGGNSRHIQAHSTQMSDLSADKTRNNRAELFMQELLDSVETLDGIAEQHGSRTLGDLMYLYNAILSGGFIDHYPGESKVMDIARSLPSGEQWTKFIKVEYMAQPVTHSGGFKSISDDDL